MQQTEKRGFNIIETSDAFSPEALNDNTRKVEAALDAMEAHADAGDAALSDRIAVFEAKKLAYGSYAGNGGSQTIQVGFTPEIVIVTLFGITPENRINTCLIFKGKKMVLPIDFSPTAFEIVDGGFYLGQGFLNRKPINGDEYVYLALG